jgi:hypothetical protein
VSLVSMEDSDDVSAAEGIIIFCDCVFEACFGRRFGVTGDGKMSLFPFHTDIGDMVVILSGARFPCILRPCEAGYRFVGMYLDDFVGDSSAGIHYSTFYSTLDLY